RPDSAVVGSAVKSQSPATGRGTERDAAKNRRKRIFIGKSRSCSDTSRWPGMDFPEQCDQDSR
ncbi:MAG TPA: hypothetical protein PLZ16_14985, partial [Gammaproteobacteria bacterium]|nr:hypothetical protein [Gammaproteobacteria bacterium]